MRLTDRRSISPASVLAMVALFVSLGGVAFAAAALPRKSVGTPQLKKNAVTSKKVRDRSLLARDFKAGELPRGPVGPTGPTGPAGPAGASMFSSAIPSGTTVTGMIHGKFDCTGNCRLGEAFPVPAPEPLAGNASVNFASDSFTQSTDDDPSCDGSFENPAAPPGKVCLYSPGFGGSNVAAATGDVFGGAAHRGFFVNVVPATAGAATEISVAWAYTAP